MLSGAPVRVFGGEKPGLTFELTSWFEVFGLATSRNDRVGAGNAIVQLSERFSCHRSNELVSAMLAIPEYTLNTFKGMAEFAIQAGINLVPLYDQIDLSSVDRAAGFYGRSLRSSKKRDKDSARAAILKHVEINSIAAAKVAYCFYQYFSELEKRKAGGTSERAPPSHGDVIYFAVQFLLEAGNKYLRFTASCHGDIEDFSCESEAEHLAFTLQWGDEQRLLVMLEHFDFAARQDKAYWRCALVGVRRELLQMLLGHLPRDQHAQLLMSQVEALLQAEAEGQKTEMVYYDNNVQSVLGQFSWLELRCFFTAHSEYLLGLKPIAQELFLRRVYRAVNEAEVDTETAKMDGFLHKLCMRLVKNVYQQIVRAKTRLEATDVMVALQTNCLTYVNTFKFSFDKDQQKALVFYSSMFNWLSACDYFLTDNEAVFTRGERHLISDPLLYYCESAQADKIARLQEVLGTENFANYLSYVINTKLRANTRAIFYKAQLCRYVAPEVFAWVQKKLKARKAWLDTLAEQIVTGCCEQHPTRSPTVFALETLKTTTPPSFAQFVGNEAIAEYAQFYRFAMLRHIFGVHLAFAGVFKHIRSRPLRGEPRTPGYLLVTFLHTPARLSECIDKITADFHWDIPVDQFVACYQLCARLFVADAEYAGLKSYLDAVIVAAKKVEGSSVIMTFFAQLKEHEGLKDHPELNGKNEVQLVRKRNKKARARANKQLKKLVFSAWSYQTMLHRYYREFKEQQEFKIKVHVFVSCQTFLTISRYVAQQRRKSLTGIDAIAERVQLRAGFSTWKNAALKAQRKDQLHHIRHVRRNAWRVHAYKRRVAREFHTAKLQCKFFQPWRKHTGAQKEVHAGQSELATRYHKTCLQLRALKAWQKQLRRQHLIVDDALRAQLQFLVQATYQLAHFAEYYAGHPVRAELFRQRVERVNHLLDELTKVFRVAVVDAPSGLMLEMEQYVAWCWQYNQVVYAIAFRLNEKLGQLLLRAESEVSELVELLSHSYLLPIPNVPIYDYLLELGQRGVAIVEKGTAMLYPRFASDVDVVMQSGSLSVLGGPFWVDASNRNYKYRMLDGAILDVSPVEVVPKVDLKAGITSLDAFSRTLSHGEFTATSLYNAQAMLSNKVMIYQVESVNPRAFAIKTLLKLPPIIDHLKDYPQVRVLLGFLLSSKVAVTDIEQRAMSRFWLYYFCQSSLARKMVYHQSLDKLGFLERVVDAAVLERVRDPVQLNMLMS